MFIIQYPNISAEMETSRNVGRKQKYYISVAFLVTALVLVQPIYSYAAKVEAIPGFDNCKLVSSQTLLAVGDPISMNTVRAKDIAKTIHVEKEIFECLLIQGDLPVIVDLTTIAEIYENMTSKSIIRKQAEVVTCIKDPKQADVIGCSMTIPSTNAVPVGSKCVAINDFANPQEMNTVNKGKIVKTIEAQKEVFYCWVGNVEKKVDVVIFKEIWEDVSKLPNDPVISESFEKFRCVVKIDTASVESCVFSGVAS